MSSIAQISRSEFDRLNSLLESAGMRGFDDKKQQSARDMAARVLIEQFLEDASQE